MAAYASLLSLMHVVDQIQLHPRPPIFLDKQQVEFLTENVNFLQEFLEGYNTHVGYINEADDLESRVADAANAAEDIIESYIVDQILVGSTSHGKKRISSIEFYQSLQKVIEDMHIIKKEVEKIKEKMGVQDQLNKNSSASAVSSPRSASTGQNSPLVGFDDILYRLKDKVVTYGGEVDLKVIPIVGMPGIGKTTLARNLYHDQSVVNHFTFLAWSTVSQEYKITKILVELLQGSEDVLSYRDENDLKEKLYKKLKGRRYLIIMDDVWDIKVWDTLKFFFPNDSNGSRIILTTRLSSLASLIPNIGGISMPFLDEDNSWELFSKTAFKGKPFPLELEEIGKTIVKNCRGLPLSIVVVGGHLAKSEPTPEYWESIAKKLNSVVNSEDKERCFKILHMSYNHLPVYLKPCFLYMGVFREDSELRFTMLIKLWVAEGFLKPISGKSPEVVAEECLRDLIDRNLILVHELGSTGNIKYCKIHDLLRDLSLREAEKKRFYNVIRQSSPNPPQIITNNAQRRIVIPQSMTKEDVPTLQSMPLSRSLICDINGNLESLINFRLLRIFEAFAKYSVYRLYTLEELFQLVNSRYLAVRLRDSTFPSSIYLLWNLHTLIVHNDSGEVECDIIAPIEIWNMPQLRHVDVGALYLPDPPSNSVDGRDYTILRNLHTFKRIMNFKCSEEVVQNIPNIMKLSIEYRELEGDQNLKNLDRLEKLECLSCYIDLDVEPSRADQLLQSLTFPKSIKKLKIGGVDVIWDDILGKIGSLPIQVLKLMHGSFKGHEWKTKDGQFQELRFLIIEDCQHLECWESDSSHFPRLKRLVLRLLKELEKIPLGIAEIDDLESIELAHCSDSVIKSAKEILEKQEYFKGNEETEVQVFLTRKSEEIESLATPKFQVRYLSLHA